MSGLRAQIVVSRDDFEVDVALEIGAGRTLALLGPNGAGKSTVVDALAGLLPFDRGRIELDGRLLDSSRAGVFVPPEERRIGVVFQDRVLFPHLTALENVAFGLTARGTPRIKAGRRAATWLEVMRLGGLADRKASELSGGEAQRVAIARALIAEPDFLVLDEPLSALDASTRVDVRRLLSDHLGEFGGPALLITHDPTEAFLLADEIHVIEGGTITQVGSADDIRLRPRTRYIADLAGSNLIVGIASEGVVEVDGHRLHIADHRFSGPVLGTVHPRAISVHRNRPEGSPRNTWETDILRIEHYGDRVRLQTAAPLPLTVEVTPGAVEALELSRGSRIWLSIKATEVAVERA